MITGIIGIRFQESGTEDDIQDIVSNFYRENSKIIEGMQYLEFRKPETLTNVLEFIAKEE